MDIVTLLVGLVIVYFGRRCETEGAGLPLVVGGWCIAVFGVVWILAARTHVFPE